MIILQVISGISMLYFFTLSFVTLSNTETDKDFIRYTILTLGSLITFIFVINC